MATGSGIILTATGCDLSWLAAALTDAGADVRIIPHADDAIALGQAFAGSGCRTVVHCHMPNIDVAYPMMAAVHDWADQCETPIRRTLVTLQAARRAFPERGTVIGLGPSFALNGTAGLVALATAVEAQRSLIKSAARQYLASGLSINWLALRTERLLPQLEGTPSLHRFEVAGGGRKRVSDSETAALIVALAGPAGGALAGQTMIADGGDWMTP